MDGARAEVHHRWMGKADAVVRQLPAARAFLLDERGVGLRATWHLDRGFANLSIWKGDRCVETFRLSMADSATLIAFLADGLAEAASAPGEPAGAPEGASGPS